MEKWICKGSSIELDKKVGSKITSKYVSQYDEYYKSSFKNTGDNVDVPSLDCWFEVIPSLRKELIALYNAEMGGVSGVESIPDAVKAVQAALFDGMCYGYNLANNTALLYTMNDMLIKEHNGVGLDEACKKVIMKKNKVGKFESYRIDSKYFVSNNSFEHKLVKHRLEITNSYKIEDDGISGVILVPYIVVVRVKKFLKYFLEKGYILKLRQELNGGTKLRCATGNTLVLEKFNGVKVTPNSNTGNYIPYRYLYNAPVPYVYVPSLGAPSTSSGVTRINMFDLGEIRVLRDTSDVLDLGVYPPKDALMSFIESRLIINIILRNKDNYSLLDVLPRNDSLLNVGSDLSKITSGLVSNYVHSLTDDELDFVKGLISDFDIEVARVKSLLYDKPRKASLEELNDIRGTLKEHICRIVVMKNDCTLSSMICTNSNKFLAKMYGYDYFGIYESFNVRFNSLYDDLSIGKPASLALRDNGFNYDMDIKGIMEELEQSEVKDKKEALRLRVAELEGVKLRKSTSTGSESNVMVRLLDAYINEYGEVVDYYRSVDKNKVVDCLILG